VSTILKNTEARASMLLDERAMLTKSNEELVATVNGRADSNYTDEERELATSYRTRTEQIDAELADIGTVLEREKASAESSKLIRGHLASHQQGVDFEDGEPVYRTFAAYARDRLIDGNPDIRAHVEREIGKAAVTDAHERLLRAPAHTLSSDVGGLLPPQHISQIMDIINAERPVVTSGNRVDLSTGTLTWPKITQRPIVGLQSPEKTETTSQKMTVTMENETADTYLGVGNLSWQAINWSTPAALDLFFQLMAEAYAIQTEAAAAEVVADAADTIGTGALAVDGTDTFAEWLAAILAGYTAIYDATRATPDTLYMSPDAFVAAAGVTSAEGAKLIDVGTLNLRSQTGRMVGLNVVVSPGFAAKQVLVGDSRALLVGETPGAPVELRAVEPSIGGLEVGIIGAFKAISFDDDRFADVGAAT
jgi:HK97 family phage major capsid protein